MTKYEEIENTLTSNQNPTAKMSSIKTLFVEKDSDKDEHDR